MKQKSHLFLLIFLFIAGCATYNSVPYSFDKKILCNTELKNSVYPAKRFTLDLGPVIVMPVIFRKLPAVSVWDKQVNRTVSMENLNMQATLSSVAAREFIKTLIESTGISVCPFNKVDSELENMSVPYWSEDIREPERIKTLLERLGAKYILFVDVEDVRSYLRNSAFDYFTYQLFSPETVYMFVWSEIYNQEGKPVGVYLSSTNLPTEASSQAFQRSAIAIGTSVLTVGLVSTLKKGEITTADTYLMPSFPKEILKASPVFRTELNTLEFLSRNILRTLLNRRDFGEVKIDLTNEILAKYASQVFYHPLISQKEMMKLEENSKVAVVCEGIGYKEGLENQIQYPNMFSPSGVKKYIKYTDEFASQLYKEFTHIFKKRGNEVVSVFAENAKWYTGSLQDFSTEVLAKIGSDVGCEVVIAVKVGWASRKIGECWVKIVDVHSKKSCIMFVRASAKKIPLRILRSAFKN